MLSPFPYIKDHTLLRHASQLEEADRLMKQRLTPGGIDSIVDSIPDEWLLEPESSLTPSERREVYRTFLKERLANSLIFLNQAIDARARLI